AVAVAGADLDAVEAREDVEEGEGDGGDAAEVDGVFDGDGVEPAAAAGAAGGGAVLVAALADVVADVVGLLGRERPAAHARAVGLHDADEVADGLRRHAGAGEQAQRGATAAGD